MRLDRFISRNVVHRFCLKGAAGHLPILMYHSISEAAETGVSPYYRTSTRPEVFREHLRLLQAAGYRAVDLKTAVQALQTGSCEKLAVVTFDDGYRDFHTAAFPILQAHSFTATVFLATGYVGHHRASFKTRECLTWGEVRELHQAGIHFGSHTVTHPKLVELDWPAIQRELCDSKADLQHHLGAPADTFAYPFAFPETRRGFVGRLRETLLEAGYICCVTTRIGRAKPGDDLMQLKRLPANSCDDAHFFQAKLDGAYDWVAPLQAGTKRLKSLLTSGRIANQKIGKAAHV